MKKLLKSKKGFTLVELLAVIVVLAIIMVIATTQVNRTINRSRANSFIESYQMVVKQVKMFIASDEDTDNIECDTADDCLEKYELSNDYNMTITDTGTAYTIVFKANETDGKFKTLDLTKYGNAASVSGETAICDTAVIGSGATACDKNSITGSVEYN